jgi:hypothetical protein
VRPGGLLAAWTYGNPSFEDADITRMLRSLHDDVVGAYWPVERGHVEVGYQSLDFPFERLAPPAIGLHASWTLEQIIGHVRIWSATRRYIAAKGDDPVIPFAGELRARWGTGVREVTWPVTIVAGRVK